MLLNSSLHGACISPFYDASLFPEEGGYVGGRLCAEQTNMSGSPLCCLPCPATYWAYSDSFTQLNTIAGWLNVVGLILQAFMLVSYTVLPTAKTRSHYLTISLVATVMFINLGFVIPLGAQPDQCYNEITPNDMYSSMTCAWSGAFLLAGALAGAFWIFIRALSMHLQICWDITPGSKFFYISQAAGWGVPAALFTAAISVTGVSFRFGNACHINHENSMVTFWGWLLAVSGAALILQLCTFGYCINVYFKSLWEDTSRPSSRCSDGSLPTSASSTHSRHALDIYRRLKSVLYLQWRSCLIVTVVLVDVIFFAIVFVYLDKLETSILNDYTQLIPWIQCLILSQGNRYECFPLSRHWLISETTVGAVLIMISLLGIELFILLFRWSLLTGWKDLWTQKSKSEFVSLDARAVSRGTPTPAYELQKPGHRFNFDFDAKSIASSAATDMGSIRGSASLSPRLGSAPQSPVVAYSPRRMEVEETGAGFPWQRTQARNFSAPARVRVSDVMEWDPSCTFARGGARRLVTPASPLKSEEEGPGQAL